MASSSVVSVRLPSTSSESYSSKVIWLGTSTSKDSDQRAVSTGS